MKYDKMGNGKNVSKTESKSKPLYQSPEMLHLDPLLTGQGLCHSGSLGTNSCYTGDAPQWSCLNGSQATGSQGGWCQQGTSATTCDGGLGGTAH